jgi:hypothetical protein
MARLLNIDDHLFWDYLSNMKSKILRALIEMGFIIFLFYAILKSNCQNET